MKILLSTDAYTTLTNGVSMVVKTLYNTYTEQGHDVRIITMSGDMRSHHEGDVYYIPSFRTPIYPDVRLSFVRRHPFINELKEWRPDVVHIHTEGPAGKLAKKIAKSVSAPIVMTWHTDYAKFAFHKHSSNRIVEWSARRLMAASYRGTNIITVPSYKAKAILDSYRLKHPNMVIPNGIILSKFTKEVTAEERKLLLSQLGISEKAKILVIVSRLSPEKDIGEIISFFPELLKKEPELHLLIVGTGPDKKHLEQMSSKLGISDSVTFSGFVPHDLTYKYYKLGIAFMSASTFEMHSLTYLEAMASGLPLICRNDPCLQGVLTDGVNGFIYNDREEFLSKALSLIEDDALREEMSENSIRISKNFSEQAFSERMLDLYKHLINEHKKMYDKKIKFKEDKK